MFLRPRTLTNTILYTWRALETYGCVSWFYVIMKNHVLSQFGGIFWVWKLKSLYYHSREYNSTLYLLYTYATKPRTRNKSHTNIRMTWWNSWFSVTNTSTTVCPWTMMLWASHTGISSQNTQNKKIWKGKRWERRWIVSDDAGCRSRWNW